eukprot:TRINITY_DN118_c0_g1_i10.p1 TRINITY_DN118_c0_g1~~TRINITY_DN118_c0_g1_i10.p1  ORF type:complete len:1227 (-),score=392.65 TRINITY_DN118_c0_g1_i10:741-4421(-)
MHLHAGGGDVDGQFGGPALDDGHQVFVEGLVGLAGGLVVAEVRRVGGCRRHIGQRARRLDLGAHGHEHAAHVRLVDDRHRAGGARQVARLHAVAGIGHGLLISAFGDRQALNAHGEARRVHHDEHVFQATVFLADQGANGTAMVAELQHRGRAGLDTQLVLDGHALHVVACAQRTIGIDQELGHDEQRNALHALGRIGGTGQHEVDDVLGHVVLTVGDEDLGTEDLVGTVALRHGAGTHQGQVGTGLRLGQVHRAGPLAGDEVGDVGFLLLQGAGRHQGFNGAVGQQRAQCKGEVGRVQHLDAGRRHQLGQALAAEFHRVLHALPAGLAELPEGFLEAGTGGDAAIGPGAGLLVAAMIERGDHFATEPGVFFQDGLGRLGRGILAARQGVDSRQAGQLVHDEQHVLQGRGITHLQPPIGNALAAFLAYMKTPRRKPGRILPGCACSAELLDQLRHDLEEIADDAVVSHREDGRFFILVDGHDDLGVLHAGQVLDRAGDTDGDIQLGGDDLAGLANLPVVGHIARIHGGAGGAHGGVQLVGQRLQDLEAFRRTHATATGDDDLGSGQFRTIRLGDLAADEAGLARIGHGRDAFHGGRATLCSRIETGGPHGDDLDRVDRLHGGNGVTGVDRALEGVGRVDLGDVGDLAHVQAGGHARQDVLAVGSGGGQDVAVILGNGQDLFGDVLGQTIGELRGIGQQHLGYARHLGSGVGGSLGIGASDQDVYVATGLCRSGDGVEGAALEAGVVVFGNNECGHDQITLASFFSLATSVATSGTFTPALRLAGSTTLSVFTRGLTSTPSSSGLTVSSGFFLAFMILGSVTQRGSFRRRSVVMMAGRVRARVSRPPSTSRVTLTLPSSSTTLEAKVACGQPSKAASIWPVWLQSSSMACLPRMISCGCSFSARALRILATASGCSSTSAPTSARMPRSAPMAMAVRRVSWHWVTPAETAITSVTLPPSFRRTASSTAISSNGFIDILTLAISTPLPSLLTRTLTLQSTTRLTGTNTFIAWPLQKGIDVNVNFRRIIKAKRGAHRNLARSFFLMSEAYTNTPTERKKNSPWSVQNFRSIFPDEMFRRAIRADQAARCATTSPRKPATRLATASSAMACRVSWVAEPMWGKATTLESLSRGESAGSGSTSNTSSPAPWMVPACRAAIMAASSTMRPREALMKMALRFIRPNSRAPIMRSVSGVKGSIRQTKSDCASSASRLTQRAPSSRSASALGRVL